MSEPMRLTLVGATGLVGTELIAAAVGRDALRVTAVTRREIAFPLGARMEAVLAEPGDWPTAIAATAPQVFACALGTTWQKAAKFEGAFRAVDLHLVLTSARAAHTAGAKRAVVVSASGADRHAKSFYLRVKGEVEEELGEIGFDRLDILRPGLLKGFVAVIGGRWNGSGSLPVRSPTCCSTAAIAASVRSPRAWLPKRCCGWRAKPRGAASSSTMTRSAAKRCAFGGISAPSALTGLRGAASKSASLNRAGEYSRFGTEARDAEGATAPESLRLKGPRGIDSDTLESVACGRPPKG